MLWLTAVMGQQINETGNLVYSTVNPAPQGADPHSWSGFTVTNSSGQGFSGGNVPAYNPNTGTFMFGYNAGRVAYSTAVNKALAYAGTGIQVSGLRYSWEYINQDFNRGTLTSNISLTSSTGQTLHNYNYNLPQTTGGWTRMSGTENFGTQYAPTSLGNLNVSFSGKDDRWWAGYYGPQVRDFGVNLLFTVAAPPPIPTEFLRWVKLTDENGEFTLTKSGVVRYGANDTYIYKSYEPGTHSCSNGAWGNDPIGGVYKSCSLGTNGSPAPPPSLVPTNNTTTATNTATAATIETSTVSLEPVTTTSIVTDPGVTAIASSNTTPTGSTSTQPGTVSAVVSAPAPASSSSSSSNSSSTSSTTQATREIQSSGSNVGLALSLISRNQERDRETLAIAQTAVSAAISAAASAQQEAASVSATAVVNSTANNAGSVTGGGNAGSGFRSTTSTGSSASQTSVFQIVQGVSSVATNSQQSQSFLTTNTGLGIAIDTTTAVQSQGLPNMGYNSSIVDTNVSVATNFLTDRTNPLNNAIEQRPQILSTPTVINTGPSVNQRVGDNEAAGGVSIAFMAVAPQGYGDYLNFTMRDVAFYEPKEVYRNQRNVDNSRALRQLTNDNRHREMVNQQYK